MTRMLTDKELKYLTIPRLQSLLKATRARAHSISSCDCCGESFKNMYPEDIKQNAEIDASWNYFERVKKELQLQQNHEQ